MTFLIADGVIPSNEGRGYVLRRLLRRAVRHGRILGVEDAFLGRLIERVIELMGKAYPEIVEHRELIVSIVGSEEERFGATLRQGMGFLETELAGLAGSGGTLDGRVAFTLHDTYGFPFELTAEIAAEKGVEVDVETFSAEMEAQRDRARAAIKDDSWSTYGGVLAEIAKESGPTEFVGYERDETDAPCGRSPPRGPLGRSPGAWTAGRHRSRHHLVLRRAGRSGRRHRHHRDV